METVETTPKERASIAAGAVAGAVAYFLLTGAPPFDGRHPVEVVSKHLNEPPALPSERVDAVPPELEALVLRCLEKKPEDRPATAVELLDAIDALDDVPPWTPADAAAWWADRAPALVEQRAEDDASPSGEAPTLLIDVDARARPSLRG